mmetsp:Transcript_3013/g.2899  ORF Transcript_3013/g.2899 Transcript_3013/m.2899 type:complete len:110 (-) Transcript_3013:1825-2154(-)
MNDIGNTEETFYKGSDTKGNNLTNKLSNIQFIPRKYVPKSKITLEHAAQCIFPGGTVTLEQKQQTLIDLKEKAKQWFRNEIGKLITSEIHNHDLCFKRTTKLKIFEYAT